MFSALLHYNVLSYKEKKHLHIFFERARKMNPFVLDLFLFVSMQMYRM